MKLLADFVILWQLQKKKENSFKSIPLPLPLPTGFFIDRKKTFVIQAMYESRCLWRYVRSIIFQKFIDTLQQNSVVLIGARLVSFKPTSLHQIRSSRESITSGMQSGGLKSYVDSEQERKNQFTTCPSQFAVKKLSGTGKNIRLSIFYTVA